MKRYIGFLCLLMVTTLGCWNYREVEELGIVSGVGIDKQENTSNYQLAIEIVNIKGGQDGQINHHPVITQGQSMFDSARNTILRTGQRAYWAHATAAVISEDLARDGILSVLDWVSRDAEVRSDIWLFVSSEKDAKSIFLTEPDLNDLVSFKLADMVSAHNSVPKFIPKELWKFKQELSAPGQSPTLPTIRIVENNGQKVPEIWGTAVFRKDKMVGWLDGLESFALSYALPKNAFGLIILPTTIEGKSGVVSYEVFGKTTMHSATFAGNRALMNVQVDLQVGIADLEGITPDYRETTILRMLEEDVSSFIKQEIRQVISRVQQEFKSDIFGFGGVIRQQLPHIWKDLESDWSEEFTKLDVRVAVNTTIRASGLLTAPIQMRD